MEGRKGGVIGDIPLFLEAPTPFDAVVSRRALVCELDRQASRGFLSSAPSASLRWMRSIALRLDDDRRRLLAIMTSDLTAQVAFVLLEHAERAEAGDQPVVRFSHQVIAELIGARRQSVSRILADLRDRGLVSLAYRRIVLRDFAGLQDVTEHEATKRRRSGSRRTLHRISALAASTTTSCTATPASVRAAQVRPANRRR